MNYNAGPPDPINFLRTVSEHDVTTYEGSPKSSKGGIDSNVPPLSPSRNQEAPARERPPPGQAWPYRENLSFTRSLIFYGAGAVTTEHVKACKNIEACRAFRKKYFGGGGCVVQEKILKDSFDDNNEKTNNDNLVFEMGENGVMEIYHSEDTEKNQQPQHRAVGGRIRHGLQKDHRNGRRGRYEVLLFSAVAAALVGLSNSRYHERTYGITRAGKFVGD